MNNSGSIHILGIDPGLNFVGYALVEAHHSDKAPTLLDVGLIRPAWRAPAGSLDKVRAMMCGVEDFLRTYTKHPIDMAVVEFQQKYQYDRSRVNPNDLIKIGYTGAVAASEIGSYNTLLVLPREWTQGRPKEINQQEIIDEIGLPVSQWPWAAKESRTNQSHAIDAVGLALWGSKQILGDSNEDPNQS